MKIFLKGLRLTALAALVAQCGSQSKNSQGEGMQVVESYYHLQVGGTPSAGLSRSYFLVLDSLPAEAQPLSMQVDNRSLSLEKTALKNTVLGYEQYSVKDSLGTPQLLKLTLQINGKEVTLSSSQVPLKKTVNLPSAPPRD